MVTTTNDPHILAHENALTQQLKTTEYRSKIGVAWRLVTPSILGYIGQQNKLENEDCEGKLKMELLQKILKGIAGIALWTYIFAALFIEGTYIPFVSDKDTSRAATTTRPPEPKSVSTTPKTQRPPVQAAMIEIYGEDLYQQYQSDGDAARAKFQGKTIIVTGIRLSIQFSPFMANSAQVDIESLMRGPTPVTCAMAGPEAEALIATYGANKDDQWMLGEEEKLFTPVTLGNGSTPIKLKGTVGSYFSSDTVELNNCSVFSSN